MKWRLAQIAIWPLLFLSAKAFAQSTAFETDQQAYCEYVSQQAMAQRDLLRTPIAISGVTQPTAALPMQLFWGVTSSLSDARKASLTMDVAQKNCDLYKSTSVAQREIQYAAPNLEKQALQHRFELIEEALAKLDKVMAETAEMMNAQNATHPMLFALQTTRIKLQADAAETQSKIVALYAPAAGDIPLKELVAQKQATEAAEQQALDKLNRQSDWDVALSVGARQQINPFGDRGAYGAVTISYNLASHSINKHLDAAANAYNNWKKVHEGDVTRSAEVLRQQVSNGISIQEARLKSLKDEANVLQGSLQLVSKPETSAALDFYNQLTSTQLLLGIEIGDASFRLQQMQDFLRKNY